MEQEAVALASHADFSMWALFARASFTVKLVMLALVIASLWAWAIIYTRSKDYRKARTELAAFEEAFWSGDPLDQLFDRVGPSPDGRAERVFAAGMTEWRRSHRETGGMIGGAQVRIDRSMDVAIQKETDALLAGLC